MRFDQGEIPFADDDEPWLMRCQEPSKAYEAFAHFRDLGPSRSLRKAYSIDRRTKGKDEGHRSKDAGVPASWNRWRKQWAWDERVAAYDARRAKIKCEIEDQAMREDLDEMVRRRRTHRRMQMDRVDRAEEAAASVLGAPLGKLREVQEKDGLIRTREVDNLKVYIELSRDNRKLAEKAFEPLIQIEEMERLEALAAAESNTEILSGGVFTFEPTPQLLAAKEEWERRQLASSSGENAQPANGDLTCCT